MLDVSFLSSVFQLYSGKDATFLTLPNQVSGLDVIFMVAIFQI